MCGLGWANDIPIWAWIVGISSDAVIIYLSYRAVTWWRRV